VSEARRSRAYATVLRATGGVYDVETPERDVVEASLRGRLKLQHRTGDRVVAGDHVELARQPDGGYTIEAVAPRTNVLARRAPRGGRGAKVIVANVDQVVVVFAAAQPEPRLRMLDRFLILAESNDIPAVVLVNKLDLADRDETATLFAPYTKAGYTVRFASVKQNEGIDAIRDVLCGRESVLAGPSGVGKSSLLNAIQPGLGLRIGAVSEAVNKGQHTTVAAQLIPLACGGYVADTPGLRELGLWGIEKDELREYFPEFLPLRDDCRFDNCTHTHEPGCAVRAAVARGDIGAARYESYVAMLNDED
jgi:ribosome biogenesis GTPase